jgi:CheY-like chemotaxis protein
MADSLDHTFRTWLGIRCKCWDAEGEKPKILLILDTDLQHAREALGGDFPVTWKIIIYPESTFQPQPSEQGVFVGVTGSLNPFKLRAALLKCHELQSARNHEAQQPCIKTDYAPSFDTTPSVQHVAIANTSSLNKSPTIHVTIKEIEAPLQVLRLNSESDDVEVKREPRFLLVDDNAINLKVIGMFAKKCSEEPFTLAAGGQEAIDAFKTTQNGADDKASAPRFDIILLDLSMPEVSGFEAASTIRSIEKAAGDRSRTYIAALTGLVSEKDRNAAFAAGVDEYVTKPASIQDLRGVVSNWRKTIPPA